MTEVSELLEALEARGWSQAAVAQELGVNYLTVWRWRHSLHMPTNLVPVVRQLRELLARKRVPRQRKAKGLRNVAARRNTDSKVE